jgi:SAM-dependent methyltransferase
VAAEDYLKHAELKGKVAEVGPGGSAAVALFLIANGCDRADLVDRFSFRHEPENLARTYARIISEQPALQDLSISPSDLSSHVAFHTGEEAAAERFFRKHTGYDAILSRAVMEHLYDPIGAMSAMASALVPGGWLLHQVDFRDHGMFSAAGHHELTFLRIPSWFYPHMTRRRGRPNRILVHRYRDELNRLGFDYRLLVTHVAGVGTVDPAPYNELPEELRRRAETTVEQLKPRFAAEFRSVSTRDLAVTGVFIVAQKPF